MMLFPFLCSSLAVRPKVRLFVKKATESAGSEVTCHVTGFYPRDVDVTWVRDRQDTLEEGVWVGEVLPNNDGTYQVRKTLTVSPEEQKKHRYTCQVDHASLKEKIEKEWGKREIERTDTNQLSLTSQAPLGSGLARLC